MSMFNGTQVFSETQLLKIRTISRGRFKLNQFGVWKANVICHHKGEVRYGRISKERFFEMLIDDCWCSIYYLRARDYSLCRVYVLSGEKPEQAAYKIQDEDLVDVVTNEIVVTAPKLTKESDPITPPIYIPPGETEEFLPFEDGFVTPVLPQKFKSLTPPPAPGRRRKRARENPEGDSH